MSKISKEKIEALYSPGTRGGIFVKKRWPCAGLYSKQGRVEDEKIINRAIPGGMHGGGSVFSRNGSNANTNANA